MGRNAHQVPPSGRPVDEGAETLLANPVATGDGVVSVLHRVLRTTGQELAYIRPLVAHLNLGVDEDLVLLFCPHLF